MAKVTNTSNQPLLVGGVQIAPHTTVEVDDRALAKARETKAVQSWFASDQLRVGEAAAKLEAAKKKRPHFAGTPAGSVLPKQPKTPIQFVPKPGSIASGAVKVHTQQQPQQQQIKK